MTYQVLARKWRPKVFDELIGQNHVGQTLLNAIRSDRVPHALLFTGPRGTGKTSTARILAKSLRCHQAKDFIPCNQCTECVDIANSRSIDVIEIDGASHNGVDAIRELRETVGFMPSSGKFKIYIIDEVHMLTTSAFNALLKTLEEPPPHVLFIMATTEAQKIPNTVLSRCQRYDFRKISTRLIAEHLQEICNRENVKTDNAALWTIARQGDGSMRDSQSLLDQVISFCQGSLTLAKITEILGLTDRGLLTKTISALITRDTKAVVGVAENIFEAGYDPIIFMKDLLEELRNLLLIKVTPDRAEHIVDLPKDEISRLSSLARELSEEDIHLLFDMALKGASDLYRAQDARIVLEMILLRMSVAPRVQNILEKSDYVAKAPAQAPAQVSNDQWTEFVDRVRKVNGLVAAQLDQLHLLAKNNQEIVIGVPTKYKFLYQQVSDVNFQKKLINYLNTFWGPGHTLIVKMIDPEMVDTKSPTQMQEKKRNDEKEAITRQIEEHPLVIQAKSILNTQIKSIREN
ncbi:MAG: DNA polymerase III, subunit gamma and tau [Bdellovibrionales bacterium RBG_16_40_8]|nr:MAG: DNA polymerase III, subunit gamma and tau [Bdellovibrionales bacterium RBG_16_40_8]